MDINYKGESYKVEDIEGFKFCPQCKRHYRLEGGKGPESGEGPPGVFFCWPCSDDWNDSCWGPTEKEFQYLSTTLTNFSFSEEKKAAARQKIRHFSKLIERGRQEGFEKWSDVDGLFIQPQWLYEQWIAELEKIN